MVFESKIQKYYNISPYPSLLYKYYEGLQFLQQESVRRFEDCTSTPFAIGSAMCKATT